jgi:uncharacterized protein YbbC (DUF1343 family)
MVAKVRTFQWTGNQFFFLFLFIFFWTVEGNAQYRITPGDCQMDAYLKVLKGKKVALLVNQTSEIDGVLLPDTLLKRGIHVVKIFSPEHGFRGAADAGAGVKDGIDEKTGLVVVSLYGKNKMPSRDSLSGVDVVVYDLQDVGVRFYTYISTLQYMMEACGNAGIPMLILDRPDPLGSIVDGPVLDTVFRSFVGMQPVPVVYGMTPGEYARMLIGENLLKGKAPALTVIPCENYTHDSLYQLPVAPSPNLKNMASVYLYPSLCLFEGTAISVGRGTFFPFQQFGHPDLKMLPDSFRPEPMTGALHPKLEGELCYGRLLANTPEEALQLVNGKMQLRWLLQAYQMFSKKDEFFNPFFNTLAGSELLQQQIKSGMTEAEIRKSWEPGLEQFRKIREKYLLYSD